MTMSKSIAQMLHEELSPAELAALFADLDDDQLKAIIADWAFWGRPEQQLPVIAWAIWYIETGRGFGKTRTASEALHEKINKGHARYGALVHRTAGDVREIMIEGESGLLATAKPGLMPKYEPSKRKITWPNGCVFHTFSAIEPDDLRGPTHDLAWGDEFATWKSVRGIDGATAFDNLRFSMRGKNNPNGPQLILTTTPKRVKAVKELNTDAALPGNPQKIVTTKGSLRDNLINLDPGYVERIISKYGGTALGEQEIDGILTADVEGALWKTTVLRATRIESEADLPELTGHCVAVDPSVGDGTGDECGITVQAVSAAPIQTTIQHGGLHVVRNLRHGYVLDDLSIAGPPDVWAATVVEAAHKWGTHTIVVEGNQGGEMVRPIMRALDAALKVKIVHARVNKEARAQPISALFAQGRWHMVGELPMLEDELTTHVFGKGQASPNRLDAMVWGAHHLEPSAGKEITNRTVKTSTYARSI